MPQVDLIGSLKWHKLGAGGIFADSPDYFLGVEISFPIVGGKAQSEYEQALSGKGVSLGQS